MSSETSKARIIEPAKAGIQEDQMLSGAPQPRDLNLDVILDVPVTLSLEVGRSRLPIRSLLQLNQGSVVELERASGEPLDVFVISYLSEATTKIGRGENARRTLREPNIVRSFKRLATWNGAPQQMKAPLAAFPRDATAVAVLLQRPNQGAIAGANTLVLQ
jgi:flagellar motor switch protein FliN